MMNYIVKFTVVLLIAASFTFAQNKSTEYRTVIPGEEYEAGWLHRILFGDHWRELWTEPISAPVLDINSFAGGLTPYEVGGGMQTRSLKFHGNDGQRWKFRSINKDPSKLLPEDLQNTLADNILSDQISSANPFAAILAAELMEAVDILQAKPNIFIMPDDPGLGEFQSEFAGMLGTLEVHPDEVDDDADADFFDTEKIKGTFKLFDTIEDKRNDKVKADEFLKVRMMDILMGDWDRHADQWRWAKVEVDNWDWWIAIPRDRDQAFVKFNGILPFAAVYLIPQLTSFNYNYPQIEDLTWNGRHIDRRFLTELPFSKWDSVTTFIQNKITDSVIVKAVKKLPAEHFKIAGHEIISKLKNRRDKLDNITFEYYELVNEVADIYGTNKDDFVLVNRIDNDFTEVTVWNLDKSESKPKGRPYFHKRFSNNITDELRIFMLDDDDYVLVKGEVDESPLVRVIGGSGKDTFVDSSIVHGNFLTITPFYDAENVTRFYDHGNASTFVKSAGTVIDREKVEEVDDIILKYEPTQVDRGHNWVLLPDAGFTTNDGVIVGANLSLYGYNFRKEPYNYLNRVSFLYAFLPSTYDISYFGEFISLFGNSDFVLRMSKSELHFTNYFGFGNENDFDRELYKGDFYRLRQERVFINPNIRFNFSDNISSSLGVFYEFNNSRLDNPQLISNFRYGNYGIGKLKNFGLSGDFRIDSRDNEFLPEKGSYIHTGGRYYFETLDSEDSYFRGEFDLRQYFTFNALLKNTLALKSSGGKVWGKYPFYHALFLGGDENLRAYTRERFSGDAAVSFQAELRTLLTELKIIIRGDLGLNLFAETGRVFTSNQASERWHPSYGGGIWVSYLDRELVFNLSYAYSKDEQNIYLDTRMAF